MTLKHLKIFVTVCRTGSTTAAARELFIAQPSISLAISEIESYYGIKLFDRIAKRLYITEVGKHFLQYATHIISLFDSMEQEIKDFDKIGTIRIGTSITIGNYFLPQYVSEFKASHPQMTVNVVIDNCHKIQQHILSNKIDIGVVEGIVNNEYIIEDKLLDDELVLICSNRHRFAGAVDVKAEDILKEDLILREVGSGGRALFESTMLTNGIEITPSWESISTQAIIKSVIANLGVSVLPYLLVKDYIKSGQLSSFRLENISFKRHFSVIYHKNKFLTESARDFINICKKTTNISL